MATCQATKTPKTVENPKEVFDASQNICIILSFVLREPMQTVSGTSFTQAPLRARKTLYLLLFLKTLLQLRVSQIGVVQVLRGPPTRRPSPPSGDRPPAQLGPDPPLLEEQPAKAGVSPWRVPVV